MANFFWSVLLLLGFLHYSYATIADTELLTTLMQTITYGLPDDWVYDANSSQYCNFTGIECITDKEHNLQHIYKINLGNLNLRGQLPLKGWSGARFISYLNLSNNHLDGPFPAELLGLFSGSIYLNNNHFNGTLPDILSNQTDFNLRILNLSSNRLTGCVPSTWKRMISLCPAENCTNMNLDNNYFNCSDYNCMQNLPTGINSFCPTHSYLCEPGKYCWHVPQTIVSIVTCLGGGFVVGNLAMFFATKYIDIGLYTRIEDDISKPINSK